MFGVVPTDDDGRVVAFIEKPPRDEAPTNLINAGTYVLEPSVLDRIAGDRRVSIEREVFPAMADEGRLYALATDDYWLDTGTPEQYLQGEPRPARRAVRRRVRRDQPRRGDRRRPRSSSGPSSVAGCHIEAGAVVHDSVLMANAVVAGRAPRSTARSSGVGATVGAGAHARPCGRRRRRTRSTPASALADVRRARSPTDARAGHGRCGVHRVEPRRPAAGRGAQRRRRRQPLHRQAREPRRGPAPAPTPSRSTTSTSEPQSSWRSAERQKPEVVFHLAAQSSVQRVGLPIRTLDAAVNALGHAERPRSGARQRAAARSSTPRAAARSTATSTPATCR